jgi:hypothetical protein
MQMKSVDHKPWFGSALFLGASSLLGVRSWVPGQRPGEPMVDRRGTVIGDGEGRVGCLGLGAGRRAVIGDGQHHPASRRLTAPPGATHRDVEVISASAAAKQARGSEGKGREGNGEGEGGKGHFLSWHGMV